MKMIQHFRAIVGVVVMLGAMVSAIAGIKDDIKGDMLAGRWAQAEQRLADVIKKHPENALAHYWNAQTLEQMGKLEQARRELDLATDLDPAEKFAGSKQQLASMRERLSGYGAKASSPAAKMASVAATTSAAASTAEVEPVAEPVQEELYQPTLFGVTPRVFALIVVLSIGGVLVLIFIAAMIADHFGHKKAVAAARVDMKCKLDEHRRLLDEALTFSDGNPDYSPEKRLWNYDRIKAMKVSLSDRAAGIDKGDITGLDAALLKAADLAAEVMGREIPSVKAEREREKQFRRIDPTTAQLYAQRTSPVSREVHHYHETSSPGSGFLTGAALVGAGMMMSSASHGETTRGHGTAADSWSSSGSGGGLLDLGGSDHSVSVDVGGGGDVSWD